jgi:uncharacterized membrane protein
MKRLLLRFLESPRSLLVAALLFSAFGLSLSLRWFLNLHMHIWDMGVFDQVVWNTAHGRWFESSLEVDNFLGDHFAPVLAVFGLLHHVIPSPYCLMLVQNLCFVLPGLFIGLLVRRRTGNHWVGWAAALLLWCHPSTLSLLTRDFSVLTLVFPLAIALYWYAHQGRLVATTILCALIMTVREDAPIAMAAVGVALLFQPGRRRLGTVLFVGGCTMTILGQWVIVPMFRSGEPPDSMSRMIDIELSLAGLGHILGTVVLGKTQWLYIISFLWGTFFLLSLTGWRLLALLFSMGHLMLMPGTLRLTSHYATLPLSLTAILLLFLFCDPSSIWTTTLRTRRTMHAWLGVATFLAVGTFLWNVNQNAWTFGPNPRSAQFEEVASHLPDNAKVAASQTVGSRIAHRRYLYLWPEIEYFHIGQTPEPMAQADYIFIDYRREKYKGRTAQVTSLRQDRAWKLVHQNGDFSLYQRGQTAQTVGHPAAPADHVADD